MKKIILIASLLMAGGLWAEEDSQICKVYDEDASRCIKGDFLLIDELNTRTFGLQILQFCEPETVVVLTDYGAQPSKPHSAMCVYTGETRATREYCDKKCQKKKNKKREG